jgi:predicted lipoprotein with Yx(FWY)xxD motif
MHVSKLFGALTAIALTTLAVGTAFAAAPANITIAQTKLGRVYATAQGMTVYEFKNDNTLSHASACYGNCAVLWPPVPAPSGYVPVKPWGTTTRTNGIKQLTYKGYPLYTWIKDVKPGDVTGQGVHGKWRVVKTAVAQTSWTRTP